MLRRIKAVVHKLLPKRKEHKPAHITLSLDYYEALKRQVEFHEERLCNIERKLSIKLSGISKIIGTHPDVIKKEKSRNMSLGQKSVWASYTPEQREYRLALTREGRIRAAAARARAESK
jgi:hypothetical protein